MLTIEQKNQWLAEWAGWYVQRNPDGDGVRWAHPDHRGRCGGGEYGWGFNRDPIASDLPNYFASLDAVHDVELKLTHDVFERYVDELISLIHEVDCGYFNKMTWPMAGELLTATAAQRAEALGLTLGLWKEGE